MNRLNSPQKVVVFLLLFIVFPLLLACFLSGCATAPEAPRAPMVFAIPPAPRPNEQPIPKGPYYLLQWTLNAQTGEVIGIPTIEAGPFDNVDECRTLQAGRPAENTILTTTPPQIRTHECGISHVDLSS